MSVPPSSVALGALIDFGMDMAQVASCQVLTHLFWLDKLFSDTLFSKA